MPESFDAYEFLGFLNGRRRWIAAACAVAVALALTFTLLAPNQYTAVTRIVIDPPAGNDPRMATAISPVYIESLRTYELFALSDSLFARALDRFELRRQDPQRSIESWKKKILKVEIPRNTKILEVRATLPDAKRAHALALYVAEETVKLNRTANLEGDQELAGAAEQQLAQARAARDQARADWMRLAQNEPVEAVEADLQSLRSRLFRLERERLDAEAALAEATERQRAAKNDADLAQRVQLARVRADHLRGQRKALDDEIGRKAQALGGRSARIDEARSRLKNADAAYDAVEARVREARGAAGYRGERLRLIDPGVVPERPSSPNLMLNLLAALTLAFAGALLFFTLLFGYQRQLSGPRPVAFRVAGRGGDD